MLKCQTLVDGSIVRPSRERFGHSVLSQRHAVMKLSCRKERKGNDDIAGKGAAAVH